MNRYLGRNSGFRPHFEMLEDRACPTVSAAIYFGNTLVITGDASANTVTVTDNGAGGISATIVGSTNTAAASGTAIKNVVINTKGGDDVVNYNLTGPLTSRLRLGIDLGYLQDTSTNQNSIDLNLNQTISAPSLAVGILGTAGQDSVTATLGAISDSYVALSAALHGGDDSFNATATGGIDGYALALAVLGGGGKDTLGATINGDVSAGTYVGVLFDGGAANDTISFDYDGQLNGKLYAALHGSHGNDTISANLIAGSGSTGSAAALVAGGIGDDTLALNIIDNSGGTLKVPFALVDGGFGTDTCTHTSNVKAIRCEP